MILRSRWIALALACAGLVGLGTPAQAADQPVRLGWYGAPRLWVIGKATALFEKNMAAKVEWAQFPSGAAALTALASKQVDIARMGSSPTVAGIARGLPVDVIAIAEVISTSERLIARAPISSIADLKGKRVAYPPGSTAHYALMAALKVNKVAPKDVTLVSLAPSEMVAAWRRGDIDAAYVWGPFTQSMEAAGGKEILSTRQLQKDGYFVFNTFVVRREFAARYPDKVVGFLRALDQSADAYRQDKDAAIQLVAKHLNQEESQVRATLEGLYTPPNAEQLEMLAQGGKVAPAMMDTGRFLVELGEIRSADLPSSFAPALNTTYMKRASGR
ncbi:aliphatic sulfonate ABC transporter substrate-binding protein [Variovorax sp. UC122_21]|uniref:taurine ABC transporter substrate-binding protein n=1 Tax=Variovorax sp. UC122_21 TaxID=3374554 RepID=UPI003757BC01